MANPQESEQLIDGFESLCSEYKDLTVRYRELQRTLQAALRECEALRTLIPERLRDFDFTNRVKSEESPAQPREGIVQCIEELYPGQSLNIGNTLETIRAAERACESIKHRKGQHRIHNDNMEVLSIRSGMPSDIRNRRVQINLPDRSSKTSPILAKDAPRCPFASMGDAMPADHPPVPNQGISTPRSSQDVLRSKRQSFHDPLRPDFREIQPISPARSVTSGPACPIRYLGEHSPEEIAKYFEEHKHELPRSHEVCIKRFQDNAQSIRELDAKYGNLVTMINGLGQKHQPMLPTEPKSQDDVAEDDESNQKIKEWAHQVTDSEDAGGHIHGPEVDKADGPDESTQAVISDDAADERQHRFERPLKDIRVGESPSRPWGVPIPAKYMHRTPSSGSNVSDAARETAPNVTDEIKDAGEGVKQQKEASREAQRRNVYRRTANQNRTSGQQPSMLSRMMEHNVAEPHKRTQPGMWNIPPPVEANDPEEQETNQKPSGIFVGRNNDGANDMLESSDDLPIVNKGIAIVSDAKHFQSRPFINHGTLVLGDYSLADLEKLMPYLTKLA